MTEHRNKENRKLAQFLLKRQHHLEEIRRPWQALWQEIADHVLPLRSDLAGTAPGGQRQDTRIYDGTALSALNLFADGMHGYLVSPALRWFRLRMPDDALNDVPEVSRWLEDVESHLYSVFNRSNFYQEMQMHFLDGGSLGTAPLYIEEDAGAGRVMFSEWHPGEVCIAENAWGEVDVVHRKYRVSARKLLQRFGKEALPRVIRDAAGDQPFREFEILHCIYPREDYDRGMLDSGNKPVASVWVWPGDGSVIRESGFSYHPVATWRYAKSGREPYGRSPASFALAEIVGLNQIGKSLLVAAQKEVDPPIEAPAKYQGVLNLKPRGVNYYDDPGSPVRPIKLGINFPVGLDREEQKRRAIREHFHVDFFLMLAQNEAARQLTATEVIERQGEKAIVLGAAVSRLNSEVLDRIIDRVFQIEAGAGRLPQPPDVLLDRPGQEVDIEYQGPLAQAQRRLFRTQGIQRSLESALPIFQLSRDSAMVINWDEALRELLESNGMPQRAIRPREDVERLRAQAEQAASMEQAAALLPQLAKSSRDLAQADKASGGEMGKAMDEMTDDGGEQ